MKIFVIIWNEVQDKGTTNLKDFWCVHTVIYVKTFTHQVFWAPAVCSVHYSGGGDREQVNICALV